MSRIEKALEQAARMRGSMGTADHASSLQALRGTYDASVFQTAGGGVDQAAVDRHIVCITDPLSTAAEEYRKLRARIFKATEKNFLNTIMVTSSQSGEGKSITAINLAVAIAHELDHTVLLIDADLRKPSIHTYLGLTPRYGLSDYLTSNRELPELLVKTGIGKLVLLPAGEPPKNPSELVASERMRALVREVKQRYGDRYIVFDSPPLLMAADAMSLCDYMDGILFVVQAARTTPKVATQALSSVKNYNILGTVFNDIPKDLAQNLYPYYYRGQFSAPAEIINGADGGQHEADPKVA